MENYESTQLGKKQIFWIIGGVIIVIMIIGIVYSSTQKTLKNTDSGSVENSLEKKDVIDLKNGEVKGVVEMVDVPVTVTGLDIVNLQTFPQRVQARIKGTVPDGCSLFTSPMITRIGNTFTISLTGTHPKDSVCTQVITPQETVIDIPVEGLPAGIYTATIGKITKTFKLVADNEIQFSSDK